MSDQNEEESKIILPEKAELEHVKNIGIWLDGVHNNLSTILYASCPAELWERKGGDIELELVGAEDREELPDGLYLTDAPAGLSDEFRAPLAISTAHIGRRPEEGVKYMAYFVNMVFPAPSATERAAARGAVREWAEEASDSPDVQEWADDLLRLGTEGKMADS